MDQPGPAAQTGADPLKLDATGAMVARSLAFAVAFYAWSIMCALLMLPLLLAPRRWMLKTMGAWAVAVTAMLRFICDVRVEVRGRQHLPTGCALVAAKHQCMFDTMGPLRGVSVTPAYVMKRTTC